MIHEKYNTHLHFYEQQRIVVILQMQNWDARGLKGKKKTPFVPCIFLIITFHTHEMMAGPQKVRCLVEEGSALNGLPLISGAVPAAGRAGSAPASGGTNLCGAWYTLQHIVWHILCLDTEKASPWPSLSMKDGCEWEFGVPKAGSPSFHRSSCHFIIPARLSGHVTIFQEQTQSLPYRW